MLVHSYVDIGKIRKIGKLHKNNKNSEIHIKITKKILKYRKKITKF